MKELLNKPSVTYFILYFGLVSLVRWQLDWFLVWWWLGGFLGLGFSWADRLAHVYVTRPFEQLSLQVKALISQQRWKDAYRLLEMRKGEQRHLTMRSALFLAAWTLMAFFVISSTGSALAVGMVMAIGLSVLLAMKEDWVRMERLKWWLFWQIKRDFTDKEAKTVVYLFAVVFGLLTIAIV